VGYYQELDECRGADRDAAEAFAEAFAEEKRRSLASAVPRMRQARQAALVAAVGSDIACPVFGRQHRKTTAAKVFCSNGRTRRGGNCKDRFWNLVDEGRRDRAAGIQRDRRDG